MLLTAAESTCNHFKTNHLENNPPSRKLIISNKCKPFSDIRGKKRIVKISEKQLYQRETQTKAGINEHSYQVFPNGDKNWLNGFQCGSVLRSWRCSMQASKQVRDEPQECEPPLLNPSNHHWTTNANVNLDTQCTSFFHHLKLSESLWNARVFPAYKESYGLLKVTVFLKKILQITRVLKASPELALLGNSNSSVPLLDSLTVNSQSVSCAGVHSSSVQLSAAPCDRRTNTFVQRHFSTRDSNTGVLLQDFKTSSRNTSCEWIPDTTR